MYKTVEIDIKFNKVELKRLTNGIYRLEYKLKEGNFIVEEKEVHYKTFGKLEDALNEFKEVSEELENDSKRRNG